MSVEELRANVDIILARPNPQSSYDLSYIGGSRDSHTGEPYLAKPGEAELIDARADALRLLYAQSSSEEQAAFPEMLRARLQESNARTLVHVAIEIGILEIVTAWLTNRPPPVRRELWAGLTEKLTYESHCFSDATITELRRVAAAERPTRIPHPDVDFDGYHLWHQLGHFDVVAREVQFQRLTQQLKEGHNPEINTDKQALISRMAQLGFRADIAATLQELDGKVLAATTPLDFKSCMEAMRTVYEEIVEDAAKTAASILNVSYPLPKTDFWPWNKVLMDTGILNADEGELTKKLYACFSNVASHRLGSAPEQLRVTKNMVIELGLLVLGRVQALKSTAPAP